MTLREVLHAHIPTLGPESTFRDAVDKMDIYQFPALVLADEAGAVFGVITEGDLCRAVQQQDGAIQLSRLPATQFATADPICASADTEIGDALHLMLSKGITILPVTHDGRLEGIVLRVDLLQAMLMDVANG